MLEVWKEVLGVKCVYEVSNLGNVRTKEQSFEYVRSNGTKVIKSVKAKPKKIQKSWNKEYLAVCLGTGNNKTIHRLVAELFIENPDHLEFVNHKDGNKHNNELSNLEWVTRQENENHAFSTGLKNSSGEHNTMSKLKNEDVIVIKNSKRDIESKNKLVENFSVSRATIERIWNGKIWRHI